MALKLDVDMSQHGAFTIEEHEHGGTVWVAIRARGAEWSWFTQEEAARVGRDLMERYGREHQIRQFPVLAAE
jgi:hypothetical protein